MNATARAAIAAIALAVSAPLAWAQTPADHEAHHPAETAPAPQAAPQPSARSGAADEMPMMGMMGMMGGGMMGRGMMGRGMGRMMDMMQMMQMMQMSQMMDMMRDMREDMMRERMMRGGMMRGPMMRGPMMRGPMMGGAMMGGPMMPGMMGGGMAGMGGAMAGPPVMRPFAHVEGQLAFYRAELGITEAQAPQWNAFADAVRSDAGKLQQAFAQAMQSGAQPAAPEQMDRHIALLSAQLDAAKAIAAAGEPLYAALSDQQKKVADELMAEHFRMMRRMGL